MLSNESQNAVHEQRRVEKLSWSSNICQPHAGVLTRTMSKFTPGNRCKVTITDRKRHQLEKLDVKILRRIELVQLRPVFSLPFRVKHFLRDLIYCFSSGWLIHWLFSFAFHLSIYWLIDWLLDWLIDWLIDWSIDWLIDGFISIQYRQISFPFLYVGSMSVAESWMTQVGNSSVYHRSRNIYPWTLSMPAS